MKRNVSLMDQKTGLISFVPGMPYTDPSYHIPAFYEVWARYAEDGRASYWRDCAKKSREYLHKSIHPLTGLNPDYNNFDGSLLNNNRVLGDAFRYDSWRVPMNIALDYSWSCSDRDWQQQYGQKFQNFLYSQGIDTFVDQYNVDGTTPEKILKAGNYPEKLRHSIGLMATAAAASIMCSHPKSDEFIKRLWEAKHEPDADGYFDAYYDGLLRLFAFMHLSGHYRVIETTPQLETYMKPVTTPTATPDSEGFVRRWMLRDLFGKTDVEEIQLNEETFWSGGPHNNNSTSSIYYLNEVRSLIFQGKEKQAEDLINKEFIKGPHGMRFLTLGSLKLDFGHKDAKNYRRELNLNNAVSTVSYTANGVKYVRETFASLEDGVIVMRIKASGKGKLNFTLDHECKLKSSKSSEKLRFMTSRMKGNYGMLKAVIEGVEQEGIKSALNAELAAKVLADGNITTDNNKVDVKNATTATIIITAATNFVNYHDVSGNASEKNKATLKAVEDKTADQLLKRHIAKYQAQYNRVALDISANTYTLPRRNSS